jgi:hypothetical protein
MRMLRFLLVVVMLALPWSVTLRAAAVAAAPAVAMAADPPAGDAPAIDVHINEGDKHVVWYADPMILAVGGIGLLLLIVVIALAAGGNRTTIIRESK